MNSNKVGPWRREDFESFLALDVDLRPLTNYVAPRNAFAQLSGLLSIGGDRMPAGTLLEQERLVNEAWKVRRAHPVYKWLAKQQTFERARKVFEQRRKKATTEKLGSPAAPFHFLKEFVQCAGWVYELRDARKRGLLRESNYGPTDRRRHAAISRATALRKLLDMGIGLDDHAKTEYLRALLQTLCNELSAMKRKPRVAKSDGERRILKVFALSLRLSCDLKSPAVLMHFAGMVGIQCETKTAQRYCNEADRKWREVLADALAKYESREGQKAARI